MLSHYSYNNIVTVNSVAGSGKTSVCYEIIKALKPKKGFYTAFNKAIVEDSKKKFGNFIDCKTIHALAYSIIKPKNIEDFSYLSVEEDISYEIKAFVIKGIDDFFRSSYTNIYEYLENTTFNETIQNLILKYTNAMLVGDIPVTFNYLLKCLHLLLLHKEVTLEYDLLILDECQDTTAVTLEIFKNIKAKKKIILGDTYQNIYSFIDTVNGFKLLNNTIDLKLTKSFRCNVDIANKVEIYGKQFLGEDFVFTGVEREDCDILTKSYIARTNASLVYRMHEMHLNHQNYTLTRPINEIFELPIALFMASKGKTVLNKKYKYLEKEYEKFELEGLNKITSFYKYLNEVVKDIQLKSAVGLLSNFNNRNINLFEVQSKAKLIRPNKNTVLTTAHAFKGLETDYVYIEDSLNSSVTNLLNAEDLSTEDEENLNIYYVAISRARLSLDNAIHAVENARKSNNKQENIDVK